MTHGRPDSKYGHKGLVMCVFVLPLVVFLKHLESED